MYAPFSQVLTLGGYEGHILPNSKATQVVLNVYDENIFLYSFFFFA